MGIAKTRFSLEQSLTKLKQAERRKFTRTKVSRQI
jgi:hypothetical protein